MMAIICGLLGGAIGWTLGSGGITMRSWRFYAIWAMFFAPHIVWNN